MAKDSGAEKYQGPGRFTSAVGGIVLWSIPAGIISGLSTLPVIKSMVGALPEMAKVESLKDALSIIPKIKGVGWLVAGAVASLGTVVYGAVSNWRKVGKAEAQLQELRVESVAKDGELANVTNARDVAVDMGHSMEKRIAELETEVKEHRSFAERHAKKESASFEHSEAPKSHAEKHGGEPHLSHAETALASKLEEATARAH